MQKPEIKISIILILFLFFSSITAVYAISLDGKSLFDNSQNQLIPDSGIIDISSDFFVENNFKRYLIFGSNPPQDNVLKNNSMYGIQSDHGFFHVSILSEKTASNLISQGYYVIEDTKLDFHKSEQIIQLT